MELAATGHRPQKLGGFSQDLDDKLYLLAYDFIEREGDITRVHTGMALGWDMAIAYAALDHGIPIVAHIPFEGQERKWAAKAQRAYHEVLNLAETSIYYAKTFDFAHYLKRDEGMVDCADKVVAMWNGVPEGGTHHTVRYSTRVGKPVTNLWAEWEQIWGIRSSTERRAQRISRTPIDEQ